MKGRFCSWIPNDILVVFSLIPVSAHVIPARNDQLTSLTAASLFPRILTGIDCNQPMGRFTNTSLANSRNVGKHRAFEGYVIYGLPVTPVPGKGLLHFPFLVLQWAFVG